MGLVCQLIAQPIITVIHVLVTFIEYVLVQICRLIQELVNAIVQVLKYVCNTVVHTVCGAVCSVVCGICDFFCGIFGCDCGCENVCNNVCNTVTDVVCGWTYVLESVLQWVTRLVCTYILQALIKLLDIIETFVTMLLTWVCTLIDVVVRGILCWTHLGDIFNNTKPRRFRVAPKIIRNKQGHSDWFVYVNNPTPAGNVDQNVRGYILSDLGRPLAPVVDGVTGAIAYYEVVTRGNVITGELKRKDGREGGFVAGQPFLYYAYKVMEIASHMWGDIFATAPGDDGHGTDFHKNLHTYNPHVQAWLNGDGKLAANTYNAWNGKYTNAASPDYFGDLSVADMGMRVDTDDCSRPTNTFLHLIHGDIGFTPGNTGVAEDMTCGAGETLSFEDTNFLMVNKDSNGAAVTTYFVSKYNMEDTQVGCNDILGYTIVTFEGSQQPLFTSMQDPAVRGGHQQDDVQDRREHHRQRKHRPRRRDLPARVRPPVRPAARFRRARLRERHDAAHRQGDEPGCRCSPRVHPLPMVHGATELVYDVAVPDAVHAGARAAGFRFGAPAAAAGRCRNSEWWSRWLKPWGQPDG